MEKVTGSAKNNVNIQLPVKVDYRILDEFLQEKLQGKVLSKGKADGSSSDHAKIRHISMGKSGLEDFDLAIHVTLELLTRFFKGKKIKVVVHLALQFDAANQEIRIDHYELDGENTNWVTNKLLETVVNTFMYSKLKQKMKVDLRPFIDKQLGALNEKLNERLELSEGINLSGKMNRFRIEEVYPGQNYLLISIDIAGNNVVNIQKIDL